MQLSDLEFDLPKRLIAQTPAMPRDHARLLVYDRQTGRRSDARFYHLGEYLPTATTLVLNNSRVEKCRLKLGSLELLVLERLDSTTCRALVKPGNKFRPGRTLDGAGVGIRILEVQSDGSRVVEFDRTLDDPTLAIHFQTPFPPYINATEELAEQYQTVYAGPLGSKAAPTAGLHFTPQLLKRLSGRHPIAELTLHVGQGTFSPLKDPDIKNHRMHRESFELSKTAAAALNAGQHLTAVGTTSARLLESVGRPFQAQTGATDIFITPGYQFQAVDALITNFHLPKSTLLLLVAAFISSVPQTMSLYRHAVDRGYRFYSFGDAMLII